MSRESSVGPDGPKPEAGRRELLLSLAGGLGFFALQGPVLGASLLLRPVAALPASFTGPTTLTRSWAASASLALTVPATASWTGTSSSPKTGTQTMTAPPPSGGYGTFTMTYPAPGWETQTVTVAETRLYKHTPPATNTRTVSWSGNSYTITSSRDVLTQTTSEMVTWSHSYTTLVEDGDRDRDRDDDGRLARIDVVPPSGAEVPIESVDGPGLDLLSPRGRGNARRLQLAHGRNA